MNVPLVTRFCNRWGSVELCFTKLALAFLLILALAVAASIWGGYRMARVEAGEGPGSDAQTLARQLDRQSRELSETRAKNDAHLDALALALGEMRARVMRLDALGERLTEMGKLDPGEFDFTKPPPQGGIESPQAVSETPSDLLGDMQGFTRLLDDREHKLQLLQQLLMTRRLSEQVRPTGMPVKHGWLSSGFGMRTDPFTGKKEFHEGLDFAAKSGSAVLAVAAGVVTWVGRESGYGNMVEIDHGDGYVSRYGHNKVILVKPGDMVSKGQTIALIGSTGRSTGPHVHLELVHNGKKVDPSKFVAVN